MKCRYNAQFKVSPRISSIQDHLPIAYHRVEGLGGTIASRTVASPRPAHKNAAVLVPYQQIPAQEVEVLSILGCVDRPHRVEFQTKEQVDYEVHRSQRSGESSLLEEPRSVLVRFSHRL